MAQRLPSSPPPSSLRSAGVHDAVHGAFLPLHYLCASHQRGPCWARKALCGRPSLGCPCPAGSQNWASWRSSWRRLGHCHQQKGPEGSHCSYETAGVRHCPRQTDKQTQMHTKIHHLQQCGYFHYPAVSHKQNVCCIRKNDF